MQKRFMNWVLAAAFILGVTGATAVQAEDLSWGTVGFQPEPQDQPAPLLFAKATKKNVNNEDTPADDKLSVGSGFWASVYGGYDFANLGALGSDINGLVNAAKGFGDSSNLGVADSGILAGVKFGYALDSTSSFDVSGEYTWTSESGLNVTSGPDTGFFFKYDPTLLGIALNYELTLLKGNGNKTSIVVGGGYYHGSVHYQTDYGEGGTTIVGDFGQDGIGGTLGVDEELSLGGNLALEITGRFRAVDFNKLTANSYTINGTSQSGGPFALVSYTPIGSNFHIEYPVSTSTALPSGVKDTDMDYTGFNGNIALKLYL